MRRWWNLWCFEGQPNQFLNIGATENTASFSQWSNKSFCCYNLSLLISITSIAPPFSLHLLFPIFSHLSCSPTLFASYGSPPPLSDFGWLISPQLLLIAFSLVSTSSLHQQHSWHCILCMEALSVFACVCIPASVQLCVCAWERL